MRFRVILILLVVIASGCKDWEYPHDFPLIFTVEIVNIGPKGADFVGRIESLGAKQRILGYGFVWGELEMPTLNSSHIFIRDNIKKGTFTRTVDSDLKEGKNYFVRTFIQTERAVIYGNQLTFGSQGSLAPSDISFTPGSGFDGTEITINGQNFSSSLEGNVVRIGSFPCEVVSASDTLLRIISPVTNVVGDFDISVTVAEKTTVANDQYSILGARFHSISKLAGRVGDLLTLEGEYFSADNFMALYFGAPEKWVPNAGPVFVKSATQLETYVPDVPNTSAKIELYSTSPSGGKRYVSPETFTIVNSWSKIGTTTPIAQYYGFVSAKIDHSVFVVGGRTLYEFNAMTKTWTKKADFPGSYRFFGTAFSFQGKFFYGFGEGYHEPMRGQNGQYYNDLWMYDPATNAWTFLMNTPLPARARQLSMVIGDKVYIGFSPNDFWQFDPVTNQWTNVPTPLETTFSRSATSFVAGNKGYIVGATFPGVSWDRYADVWEFDPSIPAWTQKSNYPDMIAGEMGTSINDHGLIISSAVNTIVSRVYEYDPAKDRWIKRQSMNSTTAPFQFAHFINGKLYYASGNLWEMSFD